MIAELKRRSPSKGIINDGLSAAAQAGSFERGGAAAISILTEPTRFGGSLADLSEAAGATALPLLRKDFHIAVSQLVEAVRHHASAVLLIARSLPPHELLLLMRAADEMSLETVVEIRTEGELEVALEGGARVIGVNSRDLETLKVDEAVPSRLIPGIPSGVVAIWESGVHSPEQVRRAADAGADAVLVGSALSCATDPEAFLRSLSTVRRQARRG